MSVGQSSDLQHLCDFRQFVSADQNKEVIRLEQLEDARRERLRSECERGFHYYCYCCVL